MCIIIIKENGKKVPSTAIKKASAINPDGLGIVWLDNFEITYHKSSEYRVLLTERPYIAHFRYATVGKVGRSNTHPFKCGKQSNEFLMMNGTIRSLGDKNECDSKVLARKLGDVAREKWAKRLKRFACRFVTVNVKDKTYQVYNKSLWSEYNGVWYSKPTVIEKHYVAVYGTLKRGNGNHEWYLGDSTFVGKGETKDRYPLVVNYLPYLIEKKGVGYNVEVDVFKVSDDVLSQLDRLEGHPKWYERKQIPILVNGKTVMCWIYFNGNTIPHGAKMYSTFISGMSASNYGASKGNISYDPVPRNKEVQDTKLQAYCINCFGNLRNESLLDYYCINCNELFDENEILKY